MTYTSEFNAIIAEQKEQTRQQDLDDLNHEQSGNDVGRMIRFLGSAAQDARDEAKAGQRKSSKFFSTLEWLLLNNPAYTAQYEATVESNQTARSKLLSYQQRLENAEQKASQALEQSIENAVTLPDGRKAHLGKDGVAWTVNNEKVENTIAAGIDWTGHETREHYLSKVEQLSKLKGLQSDSSSLEMRLGEIADRLQDHDTPPEIDELKSLQEESKAISDDIDELNQSLNTELLGQTIDNQVETSPTTLATITTLPQI